MSLFSQVCLVVSVFGLSASVPLQSVEEEIEGGPFIITKAKPEWSDKDISKALDKIAEFSKKVEARVPYQEIKEHGESLASIFKEFPEEAEIPDEVEIAIKRVAERMNKTYHYEILMECGLYLQGTYPGGYKVYFEVVSSDSGSFFSQSSKSKRLRFRIEEVGGEGRYKGESYKKGYSYEDLTNVRLVLLMKRVLN